MFEGEALIAAVKAAEANGVQVVTVATLGHKCDAAIMAMHADQRELRALQVWTPVLMLSAKDGEYDLADAFDLGADDYLTKPFSFLVLVARLRALVRRGSPARPVVMSAGSLSLDPARRRVTRGQTVLTLTPREYGVLEFLLRNKGTVLTKSQILRSVWDSNYDGDDNVVEVYIGYLRRKIDVPFGIATIETVRGVGYRLLSDAES